MYHNLNMGWYDNQQVHHKIGVLSRPIAEDLDLLDLPPLEGPQWFRVQGEPGLHYQAGLYFGSGFGVGRGGP